MNDDPTDEIFDLHANHIERETLRVEIFSDAVFAIAITLLVLEFQVPDGFTHNQLGSLIHQWPVFLGYVLSFFTIGIYWITHHNLFNFIKKTNKTMMLLNLLFLMSVCFLPYPTRLISEYNGLVATTVLYGIVLIFINLYLYFFWRYASSGHRLIDKDLSKRSISLFGEKILIATGLYCFGIIIAYFSPHWAMVAYALIACSVISYDSNVRLSRFFRRMLFMNSQG